MFKISSNAEKDINKWFFQFIASLFLMLGGAMLYDFIWEDQLKGPRSDYWPFAALAGLIMLIGVMTFVWATRRK